MAHIAVQTVLDVDRADLPVFDDLQALRREVETKAFEYSCQRDPAEGHALDDWLRAEQDLTWSPPAELAEQQDEFRVRVALPGYETEGIGLIATPGELIVTAIANEDGGEGKLWSEFGTKNAFRRIPLPSPIEADLTLARLEDGVLEIFARKAGAVRALAAVA